MSCKRLEMINLTIDLVGKRPRRLVTELSLTVEGGEAVALVGESGAGKSMTALTVMGLLPANIVLAGGDVVVNERKTSELDNEGRRRLRNRTVSMILQNPMSAFDPVFRIDSHFHETLVSHGLSASRAQSRQMAAAALAEVGFDNPGRIMSIYPFQMSGGMLQRVMIALALITNPDFLVADEATTDLDVVAQAKILSLLRERRLERHLGMLVITHDLSVAAFLADRVAVMRKGRLVETGTASEIFANPRHPYTRELLDAHRTLYTDRLHVLNDCATTKKPFRRGEVA